MKTETRKMTLSTFAEFAKAEATALQAAPDADRASTLRANLAKAATVEKADEEFEVQVQVADGVAPALDLSGIAAKLDKIDAAVAAFSAGVTTKAVYDGVVAKQGIAMQLAVELLTAYQTKVNALATSLQAGGADLDREKVWDALCSYDIQGAINNALTAIGKSEGADVAAQAEVGEMLKTALVTRAEAEVKAAAEAAEAAKKVAEEAAAKAAEEAAKAKKGACEQCGAQMADDLDVCPECGWKRGTEVSKRDAAHVDPSRYSAPKGSSYKTRFTGAE